MKMRIITIIAALVAFCFTGATCSHNTINSRHMKLIKKASSEKIIRSADITLLEKTSLYYPGATAYSVSMLPPEFRCPIFNKCAPGPCHSNYAYSTYIIYKNKAYTIKNYKPYMTNWPTYDVALKTLINDSEFASFLSAYAEDHKMKDVDYDNVKNFIQLFYLDDLLWFYDGDDAKNPRKEESGAVMKEAVRKPEIRHDGNRHEYVFFTRSVNTTEIRKWQITLEHAEGKIKIDAQTNSVGLDRDVTEDKAPPTICQKPVKERL